MHLQYGMGLDNYIELTVALPSGEVVKASKQHNSDLFWAMRGTGHQNFGVMTSMRYKLFRLPRMTYVNITYSDSMETNPEQAVKVIELWQNYYLNKGSRDLTIFPYFGTFTTQPGLPKKWTVFLACTYQKSGPGALKEVLKMLKPFLALDKHALVQTGEAPSKDVPILTGDIDPEVLLQPEVYPNPAEIKYGQYVNRTLSLTEIRQLIAGFQRPFRIGPNANQICELAYLEGYEGAMTEVAPDGSAFVHRSVGFDLVTDIFYTDVNNATQAKEAQDYLDNLY